MQTREHPAPWERVAWEGGDVKSFEIAVAEWVRAMVAEAWQLFVEVVEERIERENSSALRRKGLEERTLWTEFGPVKIVRQRYCYADGREEKSFLGFDKRVNLAPRVHAAPAFAEHLAALASIAPSYETSSGIAKLLVGDGPCAKTIWKLAQEEGKRLRRQDTEERRSVFRDGELPGTDVPAKEFVGVEADSTMIHAWRSKGENHEAFLGIVYDGKEKVGRKRRRLRNKVGACGLQGAKQFGQDLFVAAQKYHNVIDAKRTLFGSDGAACLETMRREHFPGAPHQLDWHHVTEKVRQAYGWDLIEDAKKVMELVFSEDRDGFEKQTIFDRRRLPRRRSKIDELREYVLPRWDWLFSYRRMKRKHEEMPEHLNGTGGIERNVGTVVGHRMKWRGMGWTKTGAANILRLRLKTLGLQN